MQRASRPEWGKWGLIGFSDVHAQALKTNFVLSVCHAIKAKNMHSSCVLTQWDESKEETIGLKWTIWRETRFSWQLIQTDGFAHLAAKMRRLQTFDPHERALSACAKMKCPAWTSPQCSTTKANVMAKPSKEATGFGVVEQFTSLVKEDTLSWTSRCMRLEKVAEPLNGRCLGDTSVLVSPCFIREKWSATRVDEVSRFRPRHWHNFCKRTEHTDTKNHIKKSCFCCPKPFIKVMSVVVWLCCSEMILQSRQSNPNGKHDFLCRLMLDDLTKWKQNQHKKIGISKVNC